MIDAERVIPLDVKPRVIHLLHLASLDAEGFSKFGTVLEAPSEVGGRASYSEWLGSNRQAMSPRLHLNHVGLSQLPLAIDTLEQHPYSAQAFLPVDVSRYVIVVAPKDEAGGPDLALAKAFLAPGTVGVLIAPGVWHAGATVLDREGSFGVLMWRNDTRDDEEFCQLEASLQILTK